MGQLMERLYPGGRIPCDSVPQISSVILIDRSVDFMTPLFTQLTLEGLIDSIYGIESSESYCHMICWLVSRTVTVRF